jgi:chromosome segregation and condensation protein ScpB
VSDTIKPESADDRALEEVVGAQAVAVDLREAVMACLSGQESRRWTVSELVERFKSLGICASNASVTAALVELEIEIDLSSWAPWGLVERGNEWILVPKTELSRLLLGARKLRIKAELSETHKAVLLVVIGYRRKGGVSKTRIGEILNLDASTCLDDLFKQELIYSDPSSAFNFWRPSPEALLALGLRSFADIPELKELEEWLERRSAPAAQLDSYFTRTQKLQSRRLKRELERRQTVGSLSRPRTGGESIRGQEGGFDLLRGDLGTSPLPQTVHESPESIMQSRSA